MQGNSLRFAAGVFAFVATTGGAMHAEAQTAGDRVRIIVGPYEKPVNEPQVSRFDSIHANTFIVMWQTQMLPDTGQTERARYIEY
jgi:hypothetical protein